MERNKIREAFEKADRMMKETEGHSYITILKTRCQSCGRSPKQKGVCRAWFTRFLACLALILEDAPTTS
jgi:hypothetical protein